MKLTSKEAKAVDLYKSNKALGLNAYLRGQPAGISNPVKNSIGVLDEIIDRSPISEDTSVFRGVGTLKEMFGVDNPDDLIGKEFEDKGFISTTTNVKTAALFARDDGSSASPVRNIVSIGLPKGSKALAFEDESELVLPRGSKFKIESMSIEVT